MCIFGGNTGDLLPDWVRTTTLHKTKLCPFTVPLILYGFLGALLRLRSCSAHPWLSVKFTQGKQRHKICWLELSMQTNNTSFTQLTFSSQKGFNEPDGEMYNIHMHQRARTFLAPSRTSVKTTSISLVLI